MKVFLSDTQEQEILEWGKALNTHYAAQFANGGAFHLFSHVPVLRKLLEIVNRQSVIIRKPFPVDISQAADVDVEYIKHLILLGMK